MASIAYLVGEGILVALILIEAAPLVIAILTGAGILRYRGWLVASAFTLSLCSLAFSGDYFYNLTRWTTSRFPPLCNVLICVSLLASPPSLLWVALRRSGRKRFWATGAVLSGALTALLIHNEYFLRAKRDAEALRQGEALLGPRSGAFLAHCWLDNREHGGKFFVQGHAAEGTAVTLLGDPFSRPFRPSMCAGVAAAYRPAALDPAVLGNVTEVSNLRGCDKNAIYGLCALENPVTAYREIPSRPYSGPRERGILAHPVVQEGFRKYRYETSQFDADKAETFEAAGPNGEKLFVTTLKPLRTAPNAFPCDGPILILSTGKPENAGALFPYCVQNWNFFQLNGALYFTASTQEPVPPDAEAMNADWTAWLLRVDQPALRQLWPDR